MKLTGSMVVFGVVKVTGLAVVVNVMKVADSVVVVNNVRMTGLVVVVSQCGESEGFNCCDKNVARIRLFWLSSSISIICR